MYRSDFPRAFRAAIVVACTGVSNASEFVHVADGVGYPLRLDPHRIAYSATNSARIDSTNFGFEHEQAHHVKGWTVLSSVSNGRSEAQIREVCARLGSVPDVFVSPRLIDPAGGETLVTRDLLVGFDPSRSRRDVVNTLSATGEGDLLDYPFAGLPGVCRWRCRTGDGFDVLTRAAGLRSLPEIRFAEVDFVQTGAYLATPTDPYFSSSWALENTGQIPGLEDVDLAASDAWDLTTGKGVTVVVFDGGISFDHPDLLVSFGADFTGEGAGGAPNNPCDIHGTPVAGCVAARMNNAIGSVGVAPACSLASARIASSNVPCSGFFSSQASWFVAALDWAMSIDARVSNSSLSLNLPSSALTQKFAAARAAGMVHFAGAGNSGTAVISYPASLASVNAISAIDPAGSLANYAGGCLDWNASSSFGAALDFAAPGVDIFTTDLPSTAGYSASDTICIDGTSFASPLAAGVAALVKSIAPELTAVEVEAILRETVLDLGAVGNDSSFGAGLPRAHAAVVRALTRDRSDLVIDAPSHYFESWRTGDPSPPPLTVSLAIVGGPSASIDWIATASDPSFVTIVPSSGTVDSVTPNASLAIHVDPSLLTQGPAFSTVRIASATDPNEAFEIPITLIVDDERFVVGDRLNGTVTDEFDFDTAYFHGLAGQSIAFKLAATPAKQKLRVTLRRIAESGPSPGIVEESFVLKTKKQKPKSKSIVLQQSGLFALDVEYVSGEFVSYELITKAKKLPSNAISQVIQKPYAGDGATAFFDFAALPGTEISSAVWSNLPMGPFEFSLFTPQGAIVTPNGAPLYVNGIQLPATRLGAAGAWRIGVTGMSVGQVAKLTLALSSPVSGAAVVAID